MMSSFPQNLFPCIKLSVTLSIPVNWPDDGCENWEPVDSSK